MILTIYVCAYFIFILLMYVPYYFDRMTGDNYSSSAPFIVGSVLYIIGVVPVSYLLSLL